MEDRELLREYIEVQSEAAFAELVARHIGMVYSTALRLVGDSHLASDVAQMVFIGLARKPWAIRNPEALAGWLYRSARFAAANALRNETRHREWETEAMKRDELADQSGATWTKLAPWLDEALGRLNPQDQSAVVLRFFEGKSLSEVGRTMATTEDTAQKRISRALEKLRVDFARRGMTTTAALLASAISAHATAPLPTGLAASVTGTSLAGAGSTSLVNALLKTLYMSTKTKTILAALAVAAIATIPLELQYQDNARLRAELAAARGTHAPSGIAQGQNRQAGAYNAANTGDPLSTAEIVAKIRTGSQSGLLGQTMWRDFIYSLDPAYFAQVLACIEEQLPSPNMRATMLTPLLTKWAKTKPALAMEYASNLAGLEFRTEAIKAVLNGWSESDPSAVATWWQQLPPGQLRLETAFQVLKPLAYKDPSTALELIQELAPSTQQVMLQNIFDGWAIIDPTAAIARASAMDPGFTRTLAFRSITMRWAILDPQASLAWAASLPDGPEKSIALPMAVQESARNSPGPAIDYVLNLPPGSLRDVAIRGLVSSLATAAPVDAWNLAQALPEGPDQQNARTSIIDRLAGYEPKAAMDFVANLPVDQIPPGMVTRIADSWISNDPFSALTWMKTLPSGSVREDAVTKFVSVAGKGAPSTAFAWAATLENDNLRLEQLSVVAQNWAKKDPAAATNAIQSTNLTEQQRSELLNIVHEVAPGNAR